MNVESGTPQIWTLAEKALIWCLGLGIAFGALAQGGFYPHQFKIVFVLVLLAAVARFFVTRKTERAYLAPIAAFAALGCWAVINSFVTEAVPRDAVPIGAMSLMMAAALYALSGLQSASSEALRTVVFAISVLVSVTAWTGAAFHYQSWAMPSQGLWRGASTLTYANGAAAFLAGPLIMSARAVVERRTFGSLLLSFAIGIGWVSSLSRAGALALCLVAAVAFVVSRARMSGVHLWPLTVAWVIAFVGLVPSLKEGAATQPLLSVGSLLVAVSFLLAVARFPSYGKVAALISVVVAVFAGVAAWFQAPGAFVQMQQTRLNIASSDRTDLLRAAWVQFADRPLFGVGPERLDLTYVSSGGELVRAEYVHNEYLELAAEVGLIGAACLLLACFALMRIAQSRNGLIAGLILGAFLFHSALDFLWHIPAIPLVTLVCFGLLSDHDEDVEKGLAIESDITPR